MALIPIPCTNASIVIATRPPLVYPPPFIFGLGGYDGAIVSKSVEFDFTPLRDLGQTASIRYFSFEVQANPHDVAMFVSLSMQANAPSVTYAWQNGNFLHTADDNYWATYDPVAQPFDPDLKTGPFDQTPSPGFGPYPEYFARRPTESNYAIPIMGHCGFPPVTFSLKLFFQYWLFIRSQLAYSTGNLDPVITVTNLKAWCSVYEPWNCTGDCGGPTAIASGHSALVCLQAVWVKDSDLPNGGGGGLIRPPGMFAPISVTGFDGTACNCLVTIGCLSAQQVAGGHFSGPYRYAFISSNHCNFGGVAYTRVYYADFSVTADVECSDTIRSTGNPFNLEDSQGRYHTTGVNVNGVVYQRSDFGTFAALGTGSIGVLIPHAAGKSVHDPRVIVDDRQTVRLSYAQKNEIAHTWDGVYIADANDDGATWGAGVLAIAGGKHPTVAYGTDGTFNVLVLAAYVGPDGGPGVITAKVQGAGDAALGAAFNFKDSAAADLVAADDTFHVQQARDDQSRWMLHVKINGEAATSNWVSYDIEPMTWERVA